MLSIAALYDFGIKFVSEDRYRSILVVEVEKEEYIQRILERGTLVLCVFVHLLVHLYLKKFRLILSRWACKLYGQGASYDECHQDVKRDLEVFDEIMQKSFKVTIDSANHTIPGKRHR